MVFELGYRFQIHEVALDSFVSYELQIPKLLLFDYKKLDISPATLLKKTVTSVSWSEITVLMFLNEYKL